MIALRTASTRLLRVILPVALGLFLVSPGAAEAATFEVNLATDGGDFRLEDRPNDCDVSPLEGGSQCTLRAAIEESNATAGADIVDFEIPGGPYHFLSFASPLPPLTGQVYVNGFSQPGSSPNTRRPEDGLDTELRIMLDGTGLPVEHANGFRVLQGGSGSVVQGLSMVGFANAAVYAQEGWVRVEGSFVGATPGGLEAPNGRGFLSLHAGADGSVIGGATASDSNLIHGNEGPGISANQGVTVQNNVISSNGGSGCGCGAIHLFEPNGSNLVVGNQIADNYSAVTVHNGGFDSPTQVSRNLMRGNDLINGLGIDLGGDGVSPNDADEADGLQNAPVLKRAERGSDAVRVTGRLTSRPRDTFRIELFAADGNTRQGKRYLGAVKTRTDRRGRATFSYSTRKIAKGAFVTATASALETEPVPLTSEFAKPRKVR